MNNLLLKCECSTHMLEIERFFESDNDQGFNFSIWHRSVHGKILSWKERFRWCWHIIKTGNLWSDAVIINNTNAQQIVNYINQNIHTNI